MLVVCIGVMRSPSPPLPPLPPGLPPYSIFNPSLGYARRATAPPDTEGLHYDKYRPCKSFRGAALCGIEEDEWTLARALITPASTVLELGARFGTTSCVLSQMTNNSGFVASVEIDHSVFEDLEHNRRRHHCNFLIVRAAVSRQNLYGFSRTDEYGNRALRCDSNTTTRQGCTYSGARKVESYYAERRRRGSARKIPTVSFEDVERQLGRPIDTLLIDCEGCIESLLEGQLHILRGIRLILMEEDMYAFVDYNKWHRVFQRQGFQRIWQIHDTYDRRQNGKYAWWSFKQVHSVWQRVGDASTVPSCQQYKMDTGLGDAQLLCV